jgi:hypothetical protein
MGTPLRPESREAPLWLASATSISSNVLVAVGFHRTAWTINDEGVPRGDPLHGSLQGPLPEDIFDGEGEMAHGRHLLGKGVPPVRLRPSAPGSSIVGRCSLVLCAAAAFPGSGCLIGRSPIQTFRYSSSAKPEGPPPRRTRDHHRDFRSTSIGVRSLIWCR